MAARKATTMKDEVVVSVRMPVGLRDQAKELGEREDLTMAQVLRRAVRAYVNARDVETGG